MTTANLMNLSAVKGNFSMQAEASKKLQEENLEVAEVFAGLMNQTASISNPVVDDTSSNMDVSKADGTQSVADSYERYSYKDNQIEAAEEPNITEQVEEASDTLEQAEEDVMNAISEEYGVSEEQIQEVLDDMGLSVLDLLNPQNLVSFIVELTGVASGEELLLDENFLQIMETMDNLAEGLMKELDVTMEGLQQMVDQMEVMREEGMLPASFQDVLATQMENPQATVETTDNAENNTSVEVIDAEEVDSTTNANQTSDTESAKDSVSAEQAEEVVEDGVEVKVERQEETSNVDAQATDEEATVSPQKGEESLAGNQNQEGNSLLNQNSNSNEALITNQTTVNVSQTAEMPQVQFSSYVSADTVQIVEQIVQQMRVTLQTEVTSMEMQLNPENLGKVYVQISSEEGVVNAQFHTTNEVVKEALEAQIATLRENLNQAGVKVDAIEVTIASHEFERNLEQQSQNPEEHVESQDTNSQRRRNISMDSLDELSGIMTEEETLVAQIMKDNGNSIDLTA